MVDEPTTRQRAEQATRLAGTLTVDGEKNHLLEFAAELNAEADAEEAAAIF